MSIFQQPRKTKDSKQKPTQKHGKAKGRNIAALVDTVQGSYFPTKQEHDHAMQPSLASWGSQAEVLTAGVMRFRCAVYRIYVQLSNAYVIIIMFLLSNPFGWNQ